MIRSFAKRLAQILAVIALALPGHAQQAPEEIDLRALDLDDRIYINVERDPVATLERYLQQFFRMANNGVITREQVDMRREMNLSRNRAQQITQAMMLDLDGDMVITEEEIDRQRPLLDASLKARMVLMLAYADDNGDRRLSFREVSRFVDRRMARSGSGSRRSTDQLLQFDLDGDGKVIAWEIVQIIKAIEVQRPAGRRPNVTDRVMRPGSRRSFARCGYRRLPAGESVVLVTAEVGGGLSELSLAGQEQATTVATLVIERGREPLTLMLLNRRPMIWRLRGQVERVRGVIIADRETGVLGLQRERVRLVPADNCLPAFFSLGADQAQQQARQELETAFPGTAIKIHPQRRATPIAVPSGQAQILPVLPAPRIESYGGYRHVVTPRGAVAIEGPDADLRQAALYRLGERVRRQYPTGLHRFSDAVVHSGDRLVRSAGKPAEMGLIDAIEQGQLEALSGQRYRITPSFTRFPAGLTIGRFVLPSGVAMPKGLHPGLEVRAEGSGACLPGSTCQP